MEKIPQLKDNLIYLPCTPSRWTGEPEYKKITRIRITTGGGIGGSKYSEYIEQTDDIESNKIQEFTRITGKKVKINTRYITDLEDFILVTVKLENENHNCYHLGLNTFQYIMDESLGEAILINRYGDTRTY